MSEFEERHILDTQVFFDDGVLSIVGLNTDQGPCLLIEQRFPGQEPQRVILDESRAAVVRAAMVGFVDFEEIIASLN